ncbi:MAG TPA: hypothetical protein EYP41_22460 [Anaerolineae bacterium]|nr:hypothetical protein [Anaerolineae bacterium]HIP68894.1 hypothetical protein [Chromatiales bacterium]
MAATHETIKDAFIRPRPPGREAGSLLAFAGLLTHPPAIEQVAATAAVPLVGDVACATIVVAHRDGAGLLVTLNDPAPLTAALAGRPPGAGLAAACVGHDAGVAGLAEVAESAAGAQAIPD